MFDLFIYTQPERVLVADTVRATGDSKQTPSRASSAGRSYEVFEIGGPGFPLLTQYCHPCGGCSGDFTEDAEEVF